MAVLITAAGAVTVLLTIASGLLLGPFDFFAPTIDSLRYLNSAAVVARYHSSSWIWAPYRSYLLVLPLVTLAGVVSFWPRTRGRDSRRTITPELVVTFGCIAQLLIAGLLQFTGRVEFLEDYFYSSCLWGPSCLLLALVIAKMARLSATNERWSAWVPVVAAVMVPFVYEHAPRVGAFGWWPVGLVLVVSAIAACAAALAAGPDRVIRGRLLGRTAALAVGTGCTLVVLVCVLVLDVAPAPRHGVLPGTVFDAPAPYLLALGGSSTGLLDEYKIATKLQGFVGNAAYPGEQLVTRYSPSMAPRLVPFDGIYHGYANRIPGTYPALSGSGAEFLQERRPAEVLLLSRSRASFSAAVDALALYDPVVVRDRVFIRGHVTLHAELVVLREFLGSADS